MNTADVMDPVDPAQRRHARALGLVIGGGFVALVTGFVIYFSINGLPKDPKEWKRLQERRAAAEADAKTNQNTTSESPAPKDQPR